MNKEETKNILNSITWTTISSPVKWNHTMVAVDQEFRQYECEGGLDIYSPDATECIKALKKAIQFYLKHCNDSTGNKTNNA